MNAIEQLVKDNMGLAYHQLHRFNLAYDDDAVSYALEALFNAARTYDSNKNIAFSTYASACIYNGIQMYLRRANRVRVNTTSLEDFKYENGETYLPSVYFNVSSAEQDATALSTNDIYALVVNVADKFNKASTTYKCIKAWIDSDFTLKTVQIAAAVGCSQPTVSRAINAFRNKLKEELKNVEP